jgi:signal transduction histidine kinase
MKGQVTVKSVTGRGSAFTLHLPCLEPSGRQTEEKAIESIST